MKRINWGNLGGYPAAQDDLQHADNGMIDVLLALAARGGNTKFVINGCAITRTLVGGTTYDYAIAAGYIVFGGEIVRVAAMSVAGVDESTDKIMLEKMDDSAPLTFEDTNIYNVLVDNHMEIVKYANATAEDSDKFNLSNLSNGQWQEPTLVLGTVHATQPLKYRKNLVNNSVTINGKTYEAVPVGLATNTVVFTLPTGYRPVQDMLFAIASEGAVAQLVIVRVKTNGEVSIAADIIAADSSEIAINIEIPLG